jgi:hypothetical protein
MARTRKYYSKNNYLTLRSKVKVPRRSLRYATHRLMVMRIRTICPWTVLLDLFELFDLEVKGQGPTIRYATHRLMVMHPHTNYHWPTSKEKNVMARTRKYYLKNNYLTLRSKVKVPWRSLWYATHRLMVMHLHTNYHWPISKDKNVMARTRKYYIKIIFDLKVNLGVACPDHNFFVFRDRSMIFCMWVHDLKAVCRVL